VMGSGSAVGRTEKFVVRTDRDERSDKMVLFRVEPFLFLFFFWKVRRKEWKKSAGLA